VLGRAEDIDQAAAMLGRMLDIYDRKPVSWTVVHVIQDIPPMSEKQAEANRRNALQSTGPRTEEGQAVAKLNALRHGLRAVRTVVPGEDPDEWETHRAAVVEDLKPAGPLELALAEQVAAKLWRLGRVVCYEADLITISQARDEVLQAHEKAIPHSGSRFSDLDRTDIPNFEDVKTARGAVKRAEEKLQEWEVALRVLEALDQRQDADLFSKEEWPVYDALKEDLELGEDQANKVFKSEAENFAVRHARAMLKMRGDAEEVRKGMVAYWRDEKIPELRGKTAKAKKVLKSILRRYEAALDRLRQARGLPDEAALDKIQRYEAHLERGLHKALERLQALQEARGAIPSPHKPAVALAVVQALGGVGEMASFGSLGGGAHRRRKRRP
jgi:hypothetical protein